MTMLSLAVPALAAPKAAPKADKAEKKPLNVILIMTDDQGYGDVGYVGNPYINTPFLDELCAESTCYDNFHTGTTSAPTRSGLMTGRYGNATGVWHTIGGRSLLDLEEYTMAEAFADSGYATAQFGKWHLGDNYPYRPMDRGFQTSLWHKGGGVGQTPDYFGNTYFEDTYFRGDTPEPQTGYCTDVFFGAAEDFIKESIDAEKPFFCYLAPNAPHGPYNVDEMYVEQYRNNPNVPSPEYYGMISNVDYNIGKLRAQLTRLGVADNTVLIFFGDNGTTGVKTDGGGYPISGYSGGLRGKKSQVFEGGHRQAMLFHIPGREAGKTQQLAAYIDLMPTLVGLCDLTPSEKVNFDGVDILDNYCPKGRVFINDTQRKEELAVDLPYCVIRDDWRLIGLKGKIMLYDMLTDRMQRHDVASKNPEVVKELKAEYEKWWKKTSARQNQYQYIPLIDPKSELVKLNCHDIHDTQNRQNVWNFTMLHSTLKPAPGWWCASLEKATKLNLKAYRWSPESGLALGAAAPEGRFIPNGTSYAAGGKIDDMVSITVKVDDKVVAKSDKIDITKPFASVPAVKLPAGEFKLQVLFADKDGNEYSAWFVTLEK